MSSIDPVVKKETKYIAAWVIVLSAILQAVFLIIGRWDVTVLLGNLLSGVAVIGNFFAMALTVARAVGKDKKDAAQMMKLSSAARFLALFVVVIVGVVLDCFSIWTVLIPLLFPRIAIAFRSLFDRSKGKEGVSDTNEANEG